MTEDEQAQERKRRDPLSMGFEAHRGLLLLKLRLHATAHRRRESRAQRD